MQREQESTRIDGIPKAMMLHEGSGRHVLHDGINACLFSRDGEFIVLGTLLRRLAGTPGAPPTYTVFMTEYVPDKHVLYTATTCPEGWGGASLSANGDGLIRIRDPKGGYLSDGEIAVTTSTDPMTGLFVVVPCSDPSRLRSLAMQVEWRKGG